MMRMEVMGVVLCTLLTPLTAQARGMWLLGGTKDGHVSGTVGYHGERWGLNVGGLFNSDYADKKVLDYPVPHSNYYSLGKKRTTPLLSLDVTFKLIDWGKHGLTLAGGASGYEQSVVARSRATGWLYTQRKKWKFEPDGGVFYSYQFTDLFGVVAGAHTTLGFQGGLNIAF